MHEIDHLTFDDMNGINWFLFKAITLKNMWKPEMVAISTFQAFYRIAISVYVATY